MEHQYRRGIHLVMAELSSEVLYPTSDEKYASLMEELEADYTKEEIHRYRDFMNKRVESKTTDPRIEGK